MFDPDRLTKEELLHMTRQDAASLPMFRVQLLSVRQQIQNMRPSGDGLRDSILRAALEAQAAYWQKAVELSQYSINKLNDIAQA